MHRISLLAIPAAILSATSLASAQVIPPVPPPAERTPPYTPPAPPTQPPAPTPAPRPEPEPETPLPSLVKFDDQHRLIRPDGNLEELALRAFDFDPQTRANIDKGIADFNADIDRRVIDNIDLVIRTCKARQTSDSITDLNQLAQLAASLKPIGPRSHPSLLDRLTRSNVITARQRDRVDHVVKEYLDAAAKDMADRAGNNIQTIIVTQGRQSYLDTSGDAVRGFDRLTAAAAPKMESLLAALDLSADQRATVKARLDLVNSEKSRGAAKDRRRAEILRQLCLDVLTPDQVRSLLKAANPDLLKEPAPAAASPTTPTTTAAPTPSAPAPAPAPKK